MRRWILATTWTILLLVTMTTSEECTGVYTAYMVVDGSESISSANFRVVKDALKIFINESISGNNANRIGIVIYSNDVTDVIPAASNITTLTDQIDDVLYPGKGTATHLGIERAKEGLRADRSPNPRVMIVITDGVSGYPERTSQAASQAREAGITMIAVGIDEEVKQNPVAYDKYYTGLHDIASSNNMVFQTETFGKVATDVKQIVQTLCLSVVMITDGLSDVTAPVGSSPTIRVILSEANVTKGIWTREGTDLTSDTRYVIDTEGNIQTLTILNVTPGESGEYTYTIGNTSTSAYVTVIGTATGTGTATGSAATTTTATGTATTSTTTTTTTYERSTAKTTSTLNEGAIVTSTTDDGKEGYVPLEAIIAPFVALVVILIVVAIVVALRWQYIRGYYETKSAKRLLKRKQEQETASNGTSET